MKSSSGTVLRDRWDIEDSDINLETTLTVDLDDTQLEKPIFIEIEEIETQGDYKQSNGAIALALTKDQTLQLINTLTAMVEKLKA